MQEVVEPGFDRRKKFGLWDQKSREYEQALFEKRVEDGKSMIQYDWNL